MTGSMTYEHNEFGQQPSNGSGGEHAAADRSRCLEVEYRFREKYGSDPFGGRNLAVARQCQPRCWGQYQRFGLTPFSASCLDGCELDPRGKLRGRACCADFRAVAALPVIAACDSEKPHAIPRDNR